MHNNQISKFPSPDKYANPEQFEEVNKGKSQSFANAERQDFKLLETPGPDVYHREYESRRKGGLMGKKLQKPEFFEGPSTPAPSKYRPIEDLTRYTTQRPINLYANRTNFSRSITGHKVGPGSYVSQPNWVKSELGKLSKSLKLHMKDNKVVRFWFILAWTWVI